MSNGKQTLSQANAQWSSRPQDERFKSLSDLHDAVQKRRKGCVDGNVPLQDVSLTVNGTVTMDVADARCHFTHWSLGQLCSRLGVPVALLAKLSPEVATSVLRDRLPKSIAEGDVQGRQRMLIHADDDAKRTVRALHGDVYNRVWDADVTRTLMEYLPQGWRNPVAYANGKWGSNLEPSGLYAGDRSMFAFMIDGGDWAPGQPNVGSFDVDGEQFNRGFFAWNSEVGAETFGWTSFMFDVICGNHYVWGAREVQSFRAVHRGRNATRGLYAFREYLNRLNEKGDGVDAFRDAVRIAKVTMASPVKGKDKVETLDLAFKTFKNAFTKNEIVLALDAMLREEKGVTGSRYDWLAGFTAVAREMKNADDRSALETQASLVLLQPKK
jgi:hypothetical protein